jgi:hypothetical protein
MNPEVVIFGGGITGLWLLDELRRQGKSAILFDKNGLGTGQTITSQGIIHGGLKYTLTGQLTGSAQRIREMPARWNDSLQAQQEPHLDQVAIRSHYCYLWRTNSMSSQFGMIGARIGLRVTPEKMEQAEIPELLQQAHGDVYKLPETVVSPHSLIEVLAQRNAGSLFQIPASCRIEFLSAKPKEIWGVRLVNRDQEWILSPRSFIFTAGQGNESLRELAGLEPHRMQRRPLHMLLLRGNLPDFCGHCVDGAKTRLTITSERMGPDDCVWQVGGQLAEVGTRLETLELIRHGIQELKVVLPHLNLTGIQATTYHVDRAEGVTSAGTRPESPCVIRDRSIITCWPTKLALAPVAVEEVLQSLAGIPATTAQTGARDWSQPQNWPMATVAQNPWDAIHKWVSLDQLQAQGNTSKVA